MHRWSLGDAALERSRELLADAEHARLIARSRKRRSLRRISGRVRVARVLRSLGYLLVDAGHSLEPEGWRSA